MCDIKGVDSDPALNAGQIPDEPISTQRASWTTAVQGGACLSFC